VNQGKFAYFERLPVGFDQQLAQYELAEFAEHTAKNWLSVTFGEKWDDSLLDGHECLLAFARSLCFTLQYYLRKYGGVWSNEQHSFRHLSAVFRN
jgi:hypothetical protein